MDGSKGSWCAPQGWVVLGLYQQSKKKRQPKKVSPQRIDGQSVEERRAGPSEITRDLPVH
jgi:hypothetical protein